MSERLESDYHPHFQNLGPARFLLGTNVEIVHEVQLDAPPEHVLFDFDGTLSLIRAGWANVMIPMMVEILRETDTDESGEQLQEIVTSFVMELNGKQTIYQMIRLTEEVSQRGGRELDPHELKHDYHDRLMGVIGERREGLRDGSLPREAMLVPGSVELLQSLTDRGLCLVLASGTDEVYVREEVALLGLEVFFEDRVYGAVEDYRSFSKAQVIERILSEHQITGEKLLGFGDGYVEIQNVKEVGGTAIAVASDEESSSGKVNEWKRERLIGVGADIVVPDYRDCDSLLSYLMS